MTRATARRADPAFGIVTALPDEFAAMRVMIDDAGRWHDTDDRGDYVIGTVPSADPAVAHRVVLTMLGQAGNDGAASACANLVRSFRSVRCVLMVGTAAGVPCPRDPARHVRLGDIVVATYGVVEYDSVRDHPDGPVPRRAFPAASSLLARRVSMLQAGEELGVRPWEDLISRAVRDLPAFGRPTGSLDVLYASDDGDDQVPHPDPALTGHRPGWPKVHYGRIGSGDRSLRSAAKRDQIAAAGDVLALEMEAKGIGNAGSLAGVEWFVVRGISDYGDSHVNWDWRRYASLAAAAYTRALLAECPPVPGAQPPEPPGAAGANGPSRGVVIGGNNSGVISTGDNATIAQ